MYAEGFPEKYTLVLFDSQKVNEIHGTTFGLWSSVKLNCCWAQQLLPVTSYLNNEKWAASGLLGKGNHQAGRCPSGIPAVGPAWDHGCRLCERCAKPVGHSISWAATEEASAGWRGRKDNFGEWGFSPDHHHIHLTAASVPLSSTHFVPSSAQDKKVATGPSYPEETEVVSQSVFKTAFKHLLMNPLATSDSYLRTQGRKSSQGNTAA